MAPHSRKMIGQENISTIPRKMDRATSKPLMEKRRRERINKSLSELKNILLEALKRDQSSCSKLEKADILEMTVKYLNQTKMMTGSYPSPYHQTGSQTGNGFTTGYNRAQEECIKMIRENPALTEAQKIQMIQQMTHNSKMQAAITSSPPKVARSPLLPLANQSVISPPPAQMNPAAMQYFHQLQQQQYLMSLHQQNTPTNQSVPSVQPIRRSNSPVHVGSTGQSDSESESGSQTSSNSEIFRPW